MALTYTPDYATYNSSWGFTYKSEHITGYSDKNGSHVRYQLTSDDGSVEYFEAKSTHAAKCSITRWENRNARTSQC